MTSKLTRERLEKIKSWRDTYGAGSNVMLPAEEAEELARIALAAMDSEPVALQLELAKVIYHFRDWNEGFPVERFKADYVISWMLANYPPAQPAKDREQVRREHSEWSQATFGNVGPVGPLKHLAKEAMEAAAEPDDLSEWADMQFLMWDAQRRAGITDEQITQAMIEKLAVNKQREWPEPKDGEPRLHIKEQPAPVVTFYRDGIEAAAKWIDKQREAYDSEHGWSDPDTGAFEFGNDAQRGYSSTLEELAEGIRALHPNAGNSPAIPEGYVMVPECLTAENGAKGALSGEFSETKFVNCPECFGDDECETCDGSGRIEITVPVTWTTIKEIWAKGVEHFAAAPQELK
ncbi:TPA: DUF550 domain-containing protein [Klebsiella pneumoniae]|nr:MULTISPECIES: DUF550 domain-containing protein [Klebsiella]HDU5408947.1 DUF550 domain-containing protein [Klebsiella pneumoniae subsp. pneumoniae]ELI8930687.1 DUF550 domain-containing protein [Klebsiella pneumoniae]SXB46012.1 Eaa1 [Klebsiella pneumoniae]SXB78960.1 Eaa1 [Klebsiella pneumoniae]VFZ56963.1 Eaa1 [Klebsiella pneumoniae]